MTRRHGFAYLLFACEVLCCAAGFLAAAVLYARLVQLAPADLWTPGRIREIAISAAAAWIAIAFTGNPWGDIVRLWIDGLFSAIGFNLVLQYGLDYLFHVAPAPWPLAVLGSIFAVSLIAALQKPLYRGHLAASGTTLLVGYDPVAKAILPALGAPPVGVLARAAPPAAIPYLGGFDRFEPAVTATRPGRIVLDVPSLKSAISPRRLLALRYAGVVVENAPALFESILKRVCWNRFSTLDLLLSPRLNLNRSAIALQAIYTNVIGLGLLLLSLPFLVVFSLLIALTTGAAPWETVECLGFQRIPFRLLRFRTRRRDGRPVWSGSLLSALRLVRLPQLINVVRGEMALFGPPPVRKEFAAILSDLISIYPHRFTVKPGLIGWSQANLSRLKPPDESLRLEYDLYYIREESPSLDLDILFRTIFRTSLHRSA